MNTGVSDTSEPEPARPGVAASIWALEHAQDFVSVAVGVVLIVLAATLAVSGVVSFAEDVQRHSVATAAINLLDRVLLVLILVEIVHTVVLSLRAHRLAAQPFIVVGLVAVIRRILFLLSNENIIPTSELALLIGMVVAFVALWLFRQVLGVPPQAFESVDDMLAIVGDGLVGGLDEGIVDLLVKGEVGDIRPTFAGDVERRNHIGVAAQHHDVLDVVMDCSHHHLRGQAHVDALFLQHHRPAAAVVAGIALLDL